MSTHAISNRCFVDNILDPAGAKDSGCLPQTGYWITFFVLGILTAFIPHLVYHISRCCQEPPSMATSSPSDFAPRTPPPFTATVLIPQTSPPEIPPKPPSPLLTSAAPSPPAPSAASSPQTSDLLGRNIPSAIAQRSPVSSLRKQQHAGAPSVAKKAPPPAPKPVPLPQAPSYLSQLRPSHPLELLEGLRCHQQELHLTGNKTQKLGILCIRAMALHPDKARKLAMPFSTSSQFSHNAIITFRLGTDLRAEHVRNVLTAWPTLQPHDAVKRFSNGGGVRYLLRSDQDQGCGTHDLDLTGCTHMVLDPTILTHPRFTTLKFAGCQFADINAFAAALALQKQLDTLSLGYEPMLGLTAFQNLISGCPELEKLTVAVNASSAPLFRAPTRLRSLHIRVPALTPSILNNILSNNPQLISLTLWYADIETTDIRQLVTTLKPRELESINFVNDAPSPALQKPHSEKLSGVDICLTHVNSANLFTFASPVHEHNFWLPSFHALIDRYRSNPEKLQMLLRHVAHRAHTPIHLRQLIGFGTILAEHLNWMDLSALEQVFKPLDLEFPDAPAYNCSLEILLRSALAHCVDKMNETDAYNTYGSFFTWNSEVLFRILRTHKETFINSSAILSF